MKQRFLPRDNASLVIWMANFAQKLPLYADKYGIPREDVDQIQKDAGFFAEHMTYANLVEDYRQSITQFRNSLLNDTDAPQPLDRPSFVPPTPVPPPGILRRISSVAAKIKGDKNYAVADGVNMGIEGPEVTLPDEAQHRPQLTLSAGSGGTVNIGWEKGRMTALRIERQNATGGWDFLAIDTEPDYTDTTPVAPNGHERRAYRAMYLYHDAPYGQWSDTATITIGG